MLNNSRKKSLSDARIPKNSAFNSLWLKKKKENQKQTNKKERF